MLVIRTSLIGDPAVCAAYVPFARSEVRRMGKLGIANKNFIIDKVHIRCRVIGGIGYVQIFGGKKFILESGALNLEKTQFYWLRTKEIETREVYKQGLIDVVNDPLLGTIDVDRSDPFKSKIYKLKSPPTPLPVQPPPKEEDFYNDLGYFDAEAYYIALYPDHGELYRRAKMARGLDPSKATGKMRLFLQAILGSIVSRVTYFGGLYWIDKKLALQTNYYLIRDYGGEYWMMTPTLAYHMQFNASVSEIKAALKAGVGSREYESKLEAVLFANIEIEVNPENGNAVGWYDNPWELPEGEPLNYQWHFAYMEPKAIRVRHHPDASDLAVPAPKWRTTAYYDELTFSPSVKKEDGTYTPPQPYLGTLETAKWSMLCPMDHIWYQDGITTFTSIPPIPGMPESYDAPVYAFFDKNDQPVVIRYNQTAPGPRTVEAPRTYFTSDPCQPDSFPNYTEGAYDGEGTYTSGFYTTGIDCRGKVKINSSNGFTVTYSRERSYQIAREAAVGSIAQGTVTCNGVGPFELNNVTYTRSDVYGTMYSNTDVSDTVNTVKSSILIFSINNPDAVYLGLMVDDLEYWARTTWMFTDIPFGVYYQTSEGDYDLNFVMGNPSGYSGVQSGHTYATEAGYYDVHIVSQHHSGKLEHLSWSTTSTDSGPYLPEKPYADWGSMFNVPPEIAEDSGRHTLVRESTNGRMFYLASRTKIATLLPWQDPIGDYTDKSLYYIGYA